MKDKNIPLISCLILPGETIIVGDFGRTYNPMDNTVRVTFSLHKDTDKNQGLECGKSCGTCGWFEPYEQNWDRPIDPGDQFTAETFFELLQHPSLDNEYTSQFKGHMDKKRFLNSMNFVSKGKCCIMPKTIEKDSKDVKCSLWKNCCDES